MRMPKLLPLAGAVLIGGALVPLSGLGQSVSAANGPGPTLTVVGYGVVDMTPAPSNPGPQQLQVTFQESGINAPAALRALGRDVAKARAQFEKAGVSPGAIVVQGPPNLNFNVNGGGFQDNQTLVVTFPTLMRLANALQASGVENDAGVQNVFANPMNSSAPAATAAQLTAGYQAAFVNAQQTAQIMAQGDNLQLGQAVSVTEGGASTGGCSAMGMCNPSPVGNPPQIGPNQELVTVTVTYDTGA